MLSEANTLFMDQPTNHLDLESIQSVNKGLKAFKGSLVMTSHDHRLLNTVTDKQIIIGRSGSYQYNGGFDEYLSNEKAREIAAAL
jgi:ATPase subunit of ABC transporter with duplicated ATPase domains